MIGKGVLVITIAPTEGERYQGVIGLDKPTITECLEDYFVRSEQLQTSLLFARVNMKQTRGGRDVVTNYAGWPRYTRRF